MFFPVKMEDYVTTFEGNRVILKYKRGMNRMFVGFEITSIE